MKSSIIYASKTGHSKKLANAIAKELNVQALNITANPTLENVDLLFIVGGIYGNKSLPEMIEYIKKLDKSKVKKAVFVTSCASKTVPQQELRDILIEKGIDVVQDEYICQGAFLVMGFTHPNKVDIENAVSFAKKVSIQVS